MSHELKDDNRFANTLARGLSVLRAFRSSDDGLGNSEISQRTGIPKSTVSRLTFTLQNLGYLNHAGRNDLYRPGPALLVLGNLASTSIAFVNISSPLMQKLADKTGTLVLLLVRDFNKMLIVRTWRPQSISSLWLEAGHRIPFKGSSSGHALLGCLSEKTLEQMILDLNLTEQLSLSNAKSIRQDARKQLMSKGFVITKPSDYFAPNIHAVAVPFHPRELSESVIFTCGALPDVLSEARMENEVGPQLHASLKELQDIMGQGPLMGVQEL